MKKSRHLILQCKHIIFCEDQKSSKYYLECLKKNYNKISLTIENTPTGSDYLQMLEFIKQFITNENKNKEKIFQYKEIFLVFDLDVSKQNNIQQQKLEQTLNLAKQYQINIIICDPNFEFYHLLHYETINSIATKEINSKLIKLLNKQNIAEVKSDKKLYEKLSKDKNKIKFAIENNKISLKNNYNKTDFYKLVEFIIN